jgi:MoaA/NifB/PqqE/SkfB family radical SAM enzyme
MFVERERGYRVWFEVESRCNLSCRYCYREPAAVKGARAGDILGLAKRISSLPLSGITLAGGEPLLNPALEDIGRVFSDIQVPVILATNGTLLNEAKVDSLLRCGVGTFQIPILSSTPELHDSLTGAKSWNASIGAVALARERVSHVAIIFVATRHNLCELVNVLEIATILNIDTVIFNRFISGGGRAYQRREELSIPGSGMLMQTLSEADRFAAENGINILLGTPIEISEEFRSSLTAFHGGSCTVNSGMRSFAVDSEGNARMCPQSPEILGNMVEDAPLFIARRLTGKAEQLGGHCPARECWLEARSSSKKTA